MVVASATNSFSKEMAIRRRIVGIFNRRRDDFSSLKEYNDYLEEMENTACNLIEGLDVPAIEAKIAQYQTENADQIMNAQARKAEEYAAALTASKGRPAQAGSDVISIQGFQGGVAAGAQGHFAPAIPGSAIAQPRPTCMALQPIQNGSNPDLQAYDSDDEEIITERGGMAGGWSGDLSRKRTLEEAFNGIWI